MFVMELQVAGMQSLKDKSSTQSELAALVLGDEGEQADSEGLETNALLLCA